LGSASEVGEREIKAHNRASDLTKGKRVYRLHTCPYERREAARAEETLKEPPKREVGKRA
jgi:hypothetical protein